MRNIFLNCRMLNRLLKTLYLFKSSHIYNTIGSEACLDYIMHSFIIIFQKVIILKVVINNK